MNRLTLFSVMLVMALVLPMSAQDFLGTIEGQQAAMYNQEASAFGQQAPPGGQTGFDPFGAPAAAGGFQPQQPGGFFGTGDVGAGAAGALPTPLEPTIQVVRGEWVRDAVTGQLLDAPELAEDLESNRSLYHNDGNPEFGDVFADDEIFSNVQTLDDSYIGPNTHTYILYHINMLRLLQRMDPLAFNAVLVASPDPVSPLPQLDHFEETQDNRISQWNEDFLRAFRQPDPIFGEIQADSEFYPIYVPKPPFVRPIAPDQLLAQPDLAFLEEAWVLYQGGEPNVGRLSQGQQGQAGGQFWEGGAGGAAGEPFGGEAGREWQGQSSYFGEAGNNEGVMANEAAFR